MEWCELGFGFVQQIADQTANGSLAGLLDWVKVHVTNKSEVELHMLGRELLSAFSVFLGNLSRKDLSALVGWRMVYSIIPVLAADGSTIVEVRRKSFAGGKVWHPTGLLPSNGGWIRRTSTGGPHPGDHLNRLLGCTPPRHQIKDSGTGIMKIRKCMCRALIVSRWDI